MAGRVIPCENCGCRNGLPARLWIEAYCGRCEAALTGYTRALALLRSRGSVRTAQAIIAAAILGGLFGGDLAAWWAGAPFDLTAQSGAPKADLPAAPPLPATSLIFDGP